MKYEVILEQRYGSKRKKDIIETDDIKNWNTTGQSFDWVIIMYREIEYCNICSGIGFVGEEYPDEEINVCTYCENTDFISLRSNFVKINDSFYEMCGTYKCPCCKTTILGKSKYCPGCGAYIIWDLEK